MSLAQQQRPTEQALDFNTAPEDNNRVGYDTPPSASDRETKLSPNDTSTLIVKETGTSYIDGSNWRAILEEVRVDSQYD